jgi:four helix bundle protein
MAVDSFEQLEVWQKAHAMVLAVYKETDKLPDEEEFGLILRMRQVAAQIPAFIANGFERRMRLAKLSLYRDARSAVEELRYYFILCRDLGYTINFEEMANQGEQLARMTGGLVGSVARRDRNDRGPRDRGPRDRGPRRRDEAGEGGYDSHDEAGEADHRDAE